MKQLKITLMILLFLFTNVGAEFVLTPYITALNETTELVQFEFNETTQTTLYVNGQSYTNNGVSGEISVQNLTPGTFYNYSIDGFQGNFTTINYSQETFRFAFMADSRSNDCAKQGDGFYEMIQDIRTKNVDFVLFGGDDVQTAYSCADQGYEKPAWIDLHNLTKELQSTTPIYSAIGNHENPYSAVARDEWRAYWAQPTNGDGMDGYWEEMTFYWDYGNSRFIFINTEEPGYEGDIQDKQETWLKQTLDNDKQHQFIIGHRPMVGSINRGGTLSTDNVARSIYFDELFYNNNVTATLYGHNHYYCYNQTQDHMINIISGGAGSPVYDASTCSGIGFMQKHYVLIDVNKDSISGQVINWTGGLIHTFTRNMSTDTQAPIVRDEVIIGTVQTNKIIQIYANISDRHGYNASVQTNATGNITNTTLNTNITISLAAHDQFAWRIFARDTQLNENKGPWHLTEVQNTPPELIITNLSTNASLQIEITKNATDIDNDAISFFINDTRFIETNTTFYWNTTINDSGIYKVNVTASDGEDNTSREATITIIEVSDKDDDGVPDYLDPDDDNDGVNDTIDTILGSQVRSQLNISIQVNGSVVNSFNGTGLVNFSSNNVSVVSFTFNFSRTLDLANITINQTDNYTIIRGLGNLPNGKTVQIPNSKAENTVCVKDEEVTLISEMSAYCNETNEYLLTCDGTLNTGRKCTDIGSYYVVSGLNHSALQQLCPDMDGDGYGASSCGGTDCDDADNSINPGATDVCGNSIDEDCSGSDRTCSSGGGSGGGSYRPPTVESNETNNTNTTIKRIEKTVIIATLNQTINNTPNATINKSNEEIQHVEKQFEDIYENTSETNTTSIEQISIERIPFVLGVIFVLLALSLALINRIKQRKIQN